MEAVIDVRGAEASRQIEAAERCEQHRGIEPAAEGDGHAGGRVQRRPAGEHRAQLGREKVRVAWPQFTGSGHAAPRSPATPELSPL